MFTHVCDCSKCPENNSNPSKKEGYYLVDFEGTQLLKRCSIYEQYLKDIQLLRSLKKAGLPEEMLKYSLDQDYLGEKSKDTIEKVKKFVNYLTNQNPRFLALQKLAKKSMLYFYGKNGTQKTHVAWWIIKECIKKKITAKYTTMQKLLTDLTDLNKSNPENPVYLRIEEYNSVDILVIDESFDKDKMTVFKSNYQIPFLDDFIRNRYQSGKGMIFISNVPLEKIEENKISASIEDFVKRNVLINNTLLTFEDNYLNEVNRYNGQSLITLF